MNLLLTEANGRQLGFPMAGHIDLVGGIDPYLFDSGIIQKWLQWPKASHGIKNVSSRSLEVAQRRKWAQERAFVIVTNCRFHEPPDIRSLLQWIESPPSDEFPDLSFDDPYSIHISPK